MKVFFARLQCPNSHYVIGLAGVYDSLEEAREMDKMVMVAFAEAVAAGLLKYECFICLSRELSVDIQPTAYKSMAEATPWLFAEEERQMRSNAAMKILRASRN